MIQPDFLLTQLESTYDKEDWYPPLQTALDGVTAEVACYRPPGATVNTIWENVQHLLFYKERLIHRLKGEEPTLNAANNDDTFRLPEAPHDETLWQSTLARVSAVQSELHKLVAALNEEDLQRIAPSVPLGQQIMSILMHDAFHTGEIIQLRKLQGSWPARRSFE